MGRTEDQKWDIQTDREHNTPIVLSMPLNKKHTHKHKRGNGLNRNPIIMQEFRASYHVIKD